MNKFLKSIWLVAAVAALSLSVLTLAGCNNPFNPLSQTSKIEGLSYFDWSGTWDRWDSDPAYDGFVIGLSYYNEFGDALEFRDKAHTVKIEFYTQKTVGDPAAGGYTSFDQLVFTYTTTFSNTNDDIRIAKELYASALLSHGYDITTDNADVYIILHVYPPQSFPQTELIVGYPDQTVYKPDTGDTPNG